MTKRLYLVRLEIETMVVASSESEAREYAAEHISDMTDSYDSLDFDARLARHLADGWEGDELPWRDPLGMSDEEADKSVADWLGQNASYHADGSDLDAEDDEDIEDEDEG